MNKTYSRKIYMSLLLTPDLDYVDIAFNPGDVQVSLFKRILCLAFFIFILSVGFFHYDHGLLSSS